MIDPIFVSYWAGKKYGRYANEELIPSLNLFSIAYDIQELKDRGSWEENNHLKAPFILDMMRKHRDRDIVWIDADAAVRRHPVLLFGPPPGVIACHFSICNLEARPEAYAGTVRFNNSKYAEMIVEDWIKYERLYPEAMDQVNFARALEYVDDQDIFDLPAEYHWIEYAFRSSFPKAEPVIEHFHAARKRWMR